MTARVEGAPARGGLLDDAGHAPEAPVMVVVDRLRGDDPVARRLAVRDLAHGHHRAVGLAVGVDELADGRPVRDDDVVGQEDREGLVADEVLGHQDRVAQAELLLLAHVGDLGQVADVADLAELLDLALLLEKAFQLVGEVEVVLDGPLLARGDDDHLLDAGRDGLLDGVLDDRLVDERQHLLGLSLGGRQEASAPAGCREDGFSDAHALPSGVVGGWARGYHRPSPVGQAPCEYGRGGPRRLDAAAKGPGRSSGERWGARERPSGDPGHAREERPAPSRKTRSRSPLMTRIGPP